MITQRLIMRRAAACGWVGAAFLLLSMAPSAQAEPEEALNVVPAETAAPALSPAAIAQREALEKQLGAKSTALEAYTTRAFAPVWLGANGKGSPKASALITTLARAAEHALPAEKYGATDLAARLDAGGAALEADLTAAFLSYASDISSGVLEPRRVDRELHVFPERPDPAKLIAEAAAATDVAAYLAGLAPKDPNYKRLIARYAAFQALAKSDVWGPPVRNGRTLRPGMRHDRVAQARARLTAMGDLDPDVYDDQSTAARSDDGTKLASADVTTDVPRQAFEPNLFDDQMVAALQKFQTRHGLNDDGVIGPATLRQLNVSPKTRAEQIAVNLERLRWMNRDLGERYILVNLAGFEMAVMKNGNVDFTSRVVVGKARKFRTPEFTETMTHMVINPRWNVPRSIARDEILPILREDPTYLERKNMTIVGAGDEPIDWQTVESVPGRIVQRPGYGNALGTVKFMFPNRFSIYLHDTPSKRLFSRDVRAYSHGCIRVEKPHEFAAYLLTGQAEEPEAFFKKTLNRGRERRINLDNPLPVYITYRSAWIDEQGVEQFRGDIYGRDRRVAQALKKAGVSILQ